MGMIAAERKECKTQGCLNIGNRPESGLCESCYRKSIRDSRKDLCITEGCRRTINHPTAGQCHACYCRERLSNEVETCSTKGCENTIAFKGEKICRPCYEKKWYENAEQCTYVGGCDRPIRIKWIGLCNAHYQQYNSGEFKPLRRVKGTGTYENGYFYLTRDGVRRGEHIWVMEDHMRRTLLPEETVHHKNGVRDDNRLDNLELWSSSHPGGQRIIDKLQWAHELIQLYENSPEHIL